MAAIPQPIDVSADPLHEHRRRRRAWVRVLLPLAGVTLIILAILAIVLYTDRANRQGALALSEDLLRTLEGRIALAVASYLDPAERFVRMARGIAGDDPTGAQLPLAESVATSALRQIPQLAIVSFADQDGNYVMVRRGEADGIDTKIIRNAPGERRVNWIRRDASGAEIGREDDPDDPYDPRTRPWYEGALATDGVFWTDVYIFFTDRKPGVTASLRHTGAGGRTYVYGADITLDALSEFLSTLEVGRNGRAIIMDKEGQLIASPGGSEVRSEPDGTLTPVRVDRLGDPVLAAAFDHFRVEGLGHRVIEVDGRRYVTAVTPLPGAARDWLVLMMAPESDFVGFVTSNNRTALIMSLAVVGVAALLAALLVRQGLRADRSARLLLDRQRAIERQSAAFSKLATDASLFDRAETEPPRAVTETLAEVAGARRASVWRLLTGGRILRCEDSFDRETGGHVDGLELHRDELPSFFRAVLNGEEIETPDAAGDRRTAELHRVIMNPLGSRALLCVPVRRGEEVVGALWVEDAARSGDARDFLRAAANMMLLRMAGRRFAEPAVKEREATPAKAAVPAAAARNYTAELVRRGIDPDAIEGDIYPEVAVMFVHFMDPVALSVKPEPAAQSFSNQIACALQEMAHKNDIPYLKIVGQDVVGAAGFGATNGASALLVADIAVAVRDHCLELFEHSDPRQEFRIGLDCGPAIGSSIGSAPRVFNLWGEAVRTAGAMAASALPGTIQVSEAAYERLRHDFLFRPRGSFYLPGVGEQHIFVLAGRL